MGANRSRGGLAGHTVDKKERILKDSGKKEKGEGERRKRGNVSTRRNNERILRGRNPHNGQLLRAREISLKEYDAKNTKGASTSIDQKRSFGTAMETKKKIRDDSRTQSHANSIHVVWQRFHWAEMPKHLSHYKIIEGQGYEWHEDILPTNKYFI